MRKIQFSKTWILVLILALAGLVVYVNTFDNQMFWDDEDFVLNNIYVQNFESKRFFTENMIAGAGLISNYWRPALLSIFSLQYQLWGDTAGAFHIVNTLFHISAGIVLFFVLQTLFKHKWLSFLTALVFLIHPLQTEAVSYVSSLGDSLSVFLMFTGLLFYLKKHQHWALLFYILALLSKETAIIMPGLVFLIEWYQSSFKNALKKTWQFFAVAGIYIILRATTLNFQNTFNLYNEQNMFTSNIFTRILTFFRILTVYLGLLFVPVGLHMERSVEIAASIAPDVLLGGLLFAGLIVLAFYLRNRQRIVSFGIFWFFIGLAPTSNIIVPINGLLYEHWLYLPLAGVFLVVFWTGILAVRRFGMKRPLAVFTAVILILFAVQSVRRNQDWQDPVTFFHKTLAYSPDSYRIINNLAKAYAERGDQENAERYYLQAIETDPEVPVAYHNLGNIYRDTGRTERAIEMYQKALGVDSGFSFSYSALTQLYLGQERYTEARRLLEEQLGQGRVSDTNLLGNLTQAALLQEDYQGALRYLERALQIDPSNSDIINAYIEVKRRLRSE